MRRLTLKVKPYNSETSPFYIDFRENGKRVRKFFTTETAAKKALKEITDKIRKEGYAALNVSDATRIAAVEAVKNLAPFPGATIAKAVEFYVSHLKTAQRSVPIRQLVDEYLHAKGQDKELSLVHLQDLRLRYERFCETFADTGTRTLTSQQIEEWLWSLNVSAQTQKNYRSRLGALFNFAIRRGYIDKEKNPIDDITPPKVRGGKKEIFTVDELRAVLEHARETNSEALPLIAIGAFAGVRTMERVRLLWEDRAIRGGFLTVGSEDAKTAARRTIKMEPCLQAWLSPFAGLSGLIFDGNDLKFCSQLRNLCKAVGMKKAPKNGLRHSFASYHVAKYQDAERVRGDLGLGHSTAGLLFANYRELVSPEEAERYFNIFPPSPAQNIVSMRSL